MLTLNYDPPKRLFRFMFNDGETVDVTAVRDDSNLREWVLEQHFGKRPDKDPSAIAAVVELDPQGRL